MIGRMALDVSASAAMTMRIVNLAAAQPSRKDSRARACPDSRSRLPPWATARDGGRKDAQGVNIQWRGSRTLTSPGSDAMGMRRVHTLSGIRRFKSRESRDSRRRPGQAPSSAHCRNPQGASRYWRQVADRAADRCLRRPAASRNSSSSPAMRRTAWRGAGAIAARQGCHDQDGIQSFLRGRRQSRQLLDGAPRNERRFHPGQRRQAVSRRSRRRCWRRRHGSGDGRDQPQGAL